VVLAELGSGQAKSPVIVIETPTPITVEASRGPGEQKAGHGVVSCRS